MRFTDDCYTDGRDPSMTPSVLLLPTDFIAVTDGISLSVKLDNVVVKLQNPTGCHTLAKQIEYKTVIDSLHGA